MTSLFPHLPSLPARIQRAWLAQRRPDPQTGRARYPALGTALFLLPAAVMGLLVALDLAPPPRPGAVITPPLAAAVTLLLALAAQYAARALAQAWKACHAGADPEASRQFPANLWLPAFMMLISLLFPTRTSYLIQVLACLTIMHAALHTLALLLPPRPDRQRAPA